MEAQWVYFTESRISKGWKMGKLTTHRPGCGLWFWGPNQPASQGQAPQTASSGPSPCARSEGSRLVKPQAGLGGRTPTRPPHPNRQCTWPSANLPLLWCPRLGGCEEPTFCDCLANLMSRAAVGGGRRTGGLASTGPALNKSNVCRLRTLKTVYK